MVHVLHLMSPCKVWSRLKALSQVFNVTVFAMCNCSFTPFHRHSNIAARLVPLQVLIMCDRSLKPFHGYYIAVFDMWKQVQDAPVAKPEPPVNNLRANGVQLHFDHIFATSIFCTWHRTYHYAFLCIYRFVVVLHLLVGFPRVRHLTRGPWALTLCWFDGLS